VVGITGSAGKTTTRAMTALALGALGRVHATEGNLNNHIGVPLTLLRAPLDARAWVVEMGMNHLGEIDLLQRIAEPTVRVITNVGAAHLEGVGSFEGVARAKGELFDGARAGDVCVVNDADPRVRALPLPDGTRVVRFGTAASCDVRVADAAVDPDSLTTRVRLELPGGSVRIKLDSPGVHLAWCAAAAAAVGVALHVPAAALAERIGAYRPVGMRQRIEDSPSGVRVINDAYNANPLSTAAALRTLAAMVGRRRVAVLGDMLELGSFEDALHRDIVTLALDLDLDGVALAGPRYAAAVDALGVRERVLTAPDADALGAAVSGTLAAGDVMLLKGSRGFRMERVLAHLADLPPSGAPSGPPSDTPSRGR
jgi:UDP-N-acetylmuramoyl-tripeptide--D-alanyl-D-alanine ligase